MNLMSSRKS